MGARAWEAETCAVLTELGAGATYRDRAAGLAARLGLVGVAARLEGIGDTGPTGGNAADAVCRRDRDVWSIEHRGCGTPLARIEAVLPELGSHLDRSIVTGTSCRYQPAETLTWDFQVRPKA